MFSFLVIFIFSFACIFILMQLIDRIFMVEKRIKVPFLSFTFLSSSLLLSFLLSIIGFYLMLDTLLRAPSYLGLEIENKNFDILITPNDCLLLMDTIKETESKIGQQENHRYLEEVAHLFTLKLEYQKAAQKFKEQVEIYNSLDLSPEARQYTQQISNKFQEQSELLNQRHTITTNKEGIKKVYKLLKKMDKIDRERLRLINRVKQQCNNTA